MKSNLFERKSFLEGNWITMQASNLFETKTSGNKLIVKVNLSRATANEAESLKSYFKHLPTKKIETLLIDLSDCSFVDSTFLSCLISYSKKTNAEIKLIIADPRQLAIFKITKLDSLFTIYSSLEQAIAA